jgi:hypothetical protein
MRALQLLALVALASTATVGVALADDRINLTPPLFREQARSTAAVRPASELTTTLRPVPAAPASTQPNNVVETTGSVR